MSVHVQDLIVRRLEQDLSEDEADRARRHVIDCVDCAKYARELERNEGLLRSSGRDLALPPLRLRPTARSRFALSATAAVLATAAVVVVGLLTGAALQRTRESTAVTPAPGVAGSPASVVTRELAFFQRNLGVLVLIDSAGRELRRVELGDGSYQTAAVDPATGHVAIWRFMRSGGYVPAELLVWDGGTVRVVARITDLMPTQPVWSADGLSLYFATVTPPSEANPGQSPQRSRLLVVDVGTGAIRTLRVFDGDYPLVPLVARDGFVAGFAGPLEGNVGRYMLVDATDGHDLNSAPRDRAFTAASFAVDRDGTLVAGLSRRFEGTEPSELRLWAADDYASGRALLEVGAAGRVWFWPGRGEIVVSGTRASQRYEVLAVAPDGAVRSLLTSAEPLFVEAVSPDGSSFVIGRGVAQDLVRYRVAGNGLVEDGPVAQPLQRAELVGWIASAR